MKNIRLGIKLLGGFLLTALIILAVGLLSILQQGSLNTATSELGTKGLPAVQNILVVKSEAASIAALMRTLLTPYANKEQREHSHTQLLESRKIYGAAKEKFAALPIMAEVKTEWQDFNTHITKWAGVNNQAVELSKELIALDMTQPDVMKQHMSNFETGHNALLAKTGKLLLLNIPFEGGVNETECRLGKWMQSMDTTNPEMVALVNQLKPVHAELHQNVAKIKTLVANGQQAEAGNCMKKNSTRPRNRCLQQ
jgi:methyl-accepting chemotaxis protein